MNASLLSLRHLSVGQLFKMKMEEHSYSCLGLPGHIWRECTLCDDDRHRLLAHTTCRLKSVNGQRESRISLAK